MEKSLGDIKRIRERIADKEAVRLDRQRQEEAERVGLSRHATWKEIEYVTNPAEHARVDHCHRLGLPEETTTWEQLGRAFEKEREDAAVAFGLPKDSSWSEIHAKKANEYYRVKEARELGLPDNATWEQIKEEGGLYSTRKV
jgi:hypothetical protein